MKKTANRIESYWYGKSAMTFLLLPLSWAFFVIVTLRQWAYRVKLIQSHVLPIPIIVIGNITVGGTGKTPLVIWLAQFLKKSGFRPGIISRGYGGKARAWPQQVRPDSDPRVVGDEAVLTARRCQCPMAVGPDRVKAAKSLLQYTDCNIIISDDGLQHYALARDIEIIVVDSIRRFGNGYFLPAGPLRESKTRLRTVDLVIANGIAGPGEFAMKLEPGNIRKVATKLAKATRSVKSRKLIDFKHQTVHAVAAIGHPERFFALLRRAGIKVIEHPFMDHYPLTQKDISFGDDKPIIMTEKDAVKCEYNVSDRHWVLPITAKLEKRVGKILLLNLKRKIDGQKTTRNLSMPRVQGSACLQKRAVRADM